MKTLAPVRAGRLGSVIDWNVIALRTTAAAAFHPPRDSRNAAITMVAVFDAVNSITGRFTPYQFSERAPGDSSPEAAAAPPLTPL